jgi:hypothetical protein
MEAKKDNNRIYTLIAALNSDGITPVNICADPTDHTICTSDGTTGSDNGIVDAPRDNNRIPVAMAVSSADDETPVALYADSNNKLLVQST